MADLKLLGTFDDGGEYATDGQEIFQLVPGSDGSPRPIRIAPDRQAKIAKVLESETPKPAEKPSTTASDLGHLAMRGGAQFVQDVGEVAQAAGLPKPVTQPVIEAGKSGTEYWDAGVSPEMHESLQKPFVETDSQGNLHPGAALTDPKAMAGTAAASALPMVAGMAGGAGVARAAMGAGMAPGAAGVLGGAIGEGSIAGIMDAAQVGQIVDKIPEDKLNQSEAYQRAYWGLDDKMPHPERAALAREIVKRGMMSDVGWQTSVLTAVLGAPSGYALGKILGGEEGKTLIRTMLKQGFLEGIGQEMPQSFGEQVVQNKALQTVDPSVGTYDDAANQAVGGAVVGAAMGAGMGALAHGSPPVSPGLPRPQAATREPDGAPAMAPSTTTAPPAAVPDAAFTGSAENPAGPTVQPNQPYPPAAVAPEAPITNAPAFPEASYGQQGSAPASSPMQEASPAAQAVREGQPVPQTYPRPAPAALPATEDASAAARAVGMGEAPPARAARTPGISDSPELQAALAKGVDESGPKLLAAVKQARADYEAMGTAAAERALVEAQIAFSQHRKAVKEARGEDTSGFDDYLAERAARLAKLPTVPPEGWAATGEGTDNAAPKRRVTSYSVKTEDNGDFGVKVMRHEDGSVTIFDSFSTIEYPAEFASGKSDEELFAYVYEPLGYQGSTQEVTNEEAQMPAAPQDGAPAAAEGAPAQEAGAPPVSDGQVPAAEPGQGLTTSAAPDEQVPPEPIAAQPEEIPPLERPAPAGQPLEGTDAEAIRGDQGQVPGEGAAAAGGENQGGEDLQQPAAQEAGAAAAEQQAPAPIDEAAHTAATSPQNETPEPTEAMKEAGNYQKGHHVLDGLDLSIENPAGSRRRPEWPELKSHYGYIKRTKGADEEHIDTFVKPGTTAIGKVYVVDQVNKDGSFDEHKVMLGFDSLEDATRGYKENYTKNFKVGPITEMTLDEFKDWLKNGDTSKPFAEAKNAESQATAEEQPKTETAEATKEEPSAETGPISEEGRPKGDAEKVSTFDEVMYRKNLLDAIVADSELVEASHLSLVKFGKFFMTTAKEYIERRMKDADAEQMAALQVLYSGGALNPDVFSPDMIEAAHERVKEIAAAAQTEKDDGKKLAESEEAMYSALEAANLPDETRRIAWMAGWNHAISGGTRSNMPPPSDDAQSTTDAMIAGYDAGRVSGFAKSKGKKLEGVGEQLKRIQDMQGKRPAEGDDEAVYVSDAIEELFKLTARGTVFNPTLAEDATPGAQRFLNHVQRMVSPFKTVIASAIDGPGHLVDDLDVEGVGTDVAVYSKIFKGYYDRYYGDRTIQDIVEGGVKDGTFERLEKAQSQAAEYVQIVDEVARAIDGARTVTEIEDKLKALFKSDQKYQGYIDYWFFRNVGSFSNPYKNDEHVVITDKNRKPLRRPRFDRVERRGLKDYRGGKNVTAEDLSKTFGFGGVTLGEWVSSKQRQDHLNYAYDALMDFAAHMGWKPENMSFGGKLHLAFGALGSGRHSAHYAPAHPTGKGGTVPVINLTNTRGDGALAHEYFHAIDYALRTSMTTQSPAVAKAVAALKLAPSTVGEVESFVARFLRGGSRWTNVGRKPKEEHARMAVEYTRRNLKRFTTYGEVANKYAPGVSSTRYYRDAQELDNGAGKNPYWSNDAELFARASEAWMFDSLEGSNNYLVSDWVADSATTKAQGYRGTPYPMGEERARINQVLEQFFRSIKFDGEISAEPIDYYETELKALSAKLDELEESLKPENLAKAKEEEAMRKRAQAEAQEDERRRTQAEADRRLEEERRAAEAAAAAEAAKAAPKDATEMSMEDWGALFDEALAQEEEKAQEQPEIPPQSERVSRTPAAPKKEQPLKEAEAADLARIGKEIAEHGFKAGGEALKGLYELFGGRSLRSFPGGIDEETYQKALPHFRAMWAEAKAAGKSIKEFLAVVAKVFGAGIRPYIMRFGYEEVTLGGQSAVVQPPTQESEHERDALGEGGESPLAGVAAGDDSGTQEGGDAGDRGAGSGERSGEGDAAADGERDVGAGSGGAGDENLHPATPGGRGRNGRGKRAGTGREGGAVPAGDEGSVGDNGRGLNDTTVPASNFEITDELELGKGGEVAKFKDNVAAIRALKAIESENRRATPAEQALLARYVGWGGLANAFRNQQTGAVKEGWEGRVKEIEDLLSGEELAQARNSTQNAHYTSKVVVDAMWQAAKQLGFSGGMALEPSAGAGNFLGLIPEDLKGKTRFIAIEKDSLTARIAKLLYPQESVFHTGFEKVPLPANAFDLAIGNPPFGDVSLFFQHKPGLRGVSIHNQFFRASMDSVKPGGLQIMVVSRYLMDAQDDSTRVELAKQADLVGALRLPGTAFSENARTQVVTDILFLKKRTPAEIAEMSKAFEERNVTKKGLSNAEQQARERRAKLIPTWVETTEIPDPLGGEKMRVNMYFATRPMHVLGTMDRSGTMRQNDIGVTYNDDLATDLPLRIEKLLPHLPSNDSGPWRAVPAGHAFKKGDLVRYKKSRIAEIEEAPRNPDYISIVLKPDEKNALEFSATVSASDLEIPSDVPGSVIGALERYKTMADSIDIALAGHEDGSITRKDGVLERVIERETPEGDYELFREKVSPDSPWSPDVAMDANGNWYTMQEVLNEKGEKVKEGRFVKRERKIFKSSAELPENMKLGAKGFEKLGALIDLRDLLKTQIVLETTDAPKAQMEANRKKLRDAYEAFKKAYGFINAPSNAGVIAQMPDEGLLMSLEHNYRKAVSAAKAKKTGTTARPESAEPSAIMTERVVQPYHPPTRADNAADALGISLSETGRVKLDRIASLLGISEEDAIKQLHDDAEDPLIFFDPEEGRWERRDVYLSGHVRRKLAAAQVNDLPKNVAALEAVQPKPWTSDQVTPILGGSWIPTEVYEQFLQHLVGGQARVVHSPLTNAWDVQVSNADRIKNEQEWGTEKKKATDIIASILNSREVRVTWTDSDGKTHVDQEATVEARARADGLMNEFADWVFAESNRRQMLTELFNDKFNVRVVRQNDGAHLTFPGKVPDEIISLRRSQKNAVWRGVVDRYVLLDHVVGAGKTFTAIARAMERRRMGLAKKPMVVVPNHLVQQFAADAFRLYPSAKVLSARKQDMERKNRRRFFAKIASGDWDMVILPHSFFPFIDIAQETEERYLQEELRIALDAIKEAEEAAAEAGLSTRIKPYTVKQAEALATSIQTRLDRLRAGKRDRLLTFEQLGVDDLTVDEAHEFKNLYYSSNLQNVKGMNVRSGSQKAKDLYNKVRVLRETPTGAVALMTGTPISNSAVEMYQMMRYLAADELQALGLEHFDAWRAQYVGIATKMEPDETGKLRDVNRLGRMWSNMRSLMELYYSFADTVTLDDLKQQYREDRGGEFPVPKVKGGIRQPIKTEPTPAQEELLKNIINGFESLPNIQNPKERAAERLRLMDRARKVSVDVRAALPRSDSKEPGGKLEAVSREVKRLYDQWQEDKGTQLVFLDRSVPKAKGDKEKIKAYDALKAEEEQALRDRDEAAYQAVQDKLEKFDPTEIEEMRAAQGGGWNAYQQIKDNLVALGVPESEIRFIHEANTPLQKQAIFDAVNDGDVRVLIGNTPRMGAGTNVQERLVGLHHVDVGWKPSDVEQREGRIIRQGNSLLDKYGPDFTVEILAYITERTIDAKMWNVNSEKLRTINAIRKYDGSFTMESTDEDSVSMAELSAIASGDPLLIERVNLMATIDRLEVLERAHRRRAHSIADQIVSAEKKLERLPKRIERMKRLSAQQEALKKRIKAANAEEKLKIGDKEYTSAFDAQAAAQEIIDGWPEDKGPWSIQIGEEKFTNKEKLKAAIDDAFSDKSPFSASVGGVEYRSRGKYERALRPIIAQAFEALGKDMEKVETIDLGEFAGLKVTADIHLSEGLLTKMGKENFKRSLNHNIDFTLIDDQGEAVASFGTSSDEPTFSLQKMMGLVHSIEQRLEGETGNLSLQMRENELATAQKELPELKDQQSKPFAKKDELEKARARLEAVTKALANGTALEPETPEQRFAKVEVGPETDFSFSNTKADIDAYLASMLGAKGLDLLRNGTIRVVESAKDLPPRAQAAGNVAGWYDPETDASYIVANRVSTKTKAFNNAYAVLAHERAVHQGMPGMLGARMWGETLAQIDVARSMSGDSPLVAAVREASAMVPADTPAHLLAEETLAYMVQMRANHELPLIKRIFARIRAFLYRHGFWKDIDPDMLALIARDAIFARTRGGAGIEMPSTLANAAGWTDKRVEHLLKLYAVGHKPEMTAAYKVWMSPEQFLKLTAGGEGQLAYIEKGSRPLDPAELRAENQEIYLTVEDISDRILQVTGHEGRHRMVALRDAGITRVSVSVSNRFMSDRIAAKPKMSALFSPQKGLGGSGSVFIDEEMIPISYAYKDQLSDEGKPDLLFSRMRVIDTTAGPLFEGRDFSLFPSGKEGDQSNYIIVDNESGGGVGELVLGIENGKIARAYAIVIDEDMRNTKIARRVLMGIIDTIDQPIEIRDIVNPDLLRALRRMGLYGETDGEAEGSRNGFLAPRQPGPEGGDGSKRQAREGRSNAGAGAARTGAGSETGQRYSVVSGSAEEIARAARLKVGDLLQSQRGFNRWWHTTVGTQFHKAQQVPEFGRVFDLGQDYLTGVSKFAMEAEEKAPDLLLRMEGFSDIFKRGASSADLEAIAAPIFEGTLAGGADPERGRKWSDDHLRAQFGLNDRQIRYYHQAQESVAESLRTLAKSTITRLMQNTIRTMPLDQSLGMNDFAADIRGRVEKLIEDESLKQQVTTDRQAIVRSKAQVQEYRALLDAIEGIEGKAERLIAHGYFPLMRFGEHTVYVTSEDPATGKPNEVFFGMYESQGKANAAARALREEYPGATVQQGIMSKEAYRMFRGVSPETLALFGEHLGLENDAAMQEFLRLAVNSRSAMTRLIHRKGMAGYSKDVLRTLASFVTSNSRLASQNIYMGQMRRAVDEIPSSMGDVKDEAVRLHEYLVNPQEEAGKLRGFLFFNFLGGSIASALVNATQPVTMTLPYLSQFVNPVEAAAVLTQASMEGATGKPGKDVAEAYQRALEDGIIAPHEIHQLMATTRGIQTGARWLHRFTKVWGGFFSMAEAFNRRSTFIAAYRVAVKKKIADPYAFATKAVYDTQGIYNRGNRPNWARGPVGATVFTFKQFSIAYVEFLKRLPIPQRILALAILALGAGLDQLPFAEDLEDIVDTVGQWMGYATNTRRWRDERIAEIVGRDVADWIANGVSMGLPMDISMRIGMGNLIPGTALLKPSETDKGREVTQVLGPAAGFAYNMGHGLDRAARGDFSSMSKLVTPKALRDMITAVEMYQTGEARNQRGDRIGATTPQDAVVRGLGFTPSQTARDSKAMSDVYDDVALQKLTEDAIASKWARGLIDYKPEMVREARAELADWNSKNPELPIMITPRQLQQRVVAGRKDRRERFIKTVPKEIRGRIAERLPE